MSSNSALCLPVTLVVQRNMQKPIFMRPLPRGATSGTARRLARKIWSYQMEIIETACRGAAPRSSPSAGCSPMRDHDVADHRVVLQRIERHVLAIAGLLDAAMRHLV